MSLIQDNIARVRERIAQACARVRRPPESVTLVAVSKTHPAEMIMAVVEAGVQHFGENRVEEGSVKIPDANRLAMERFGQTPTWHMIGHIQSRKARDVPPLFQVVHSVDSLKLATKLANALAGDRTLDVLIEINVSGEESKSGLAAAGWERDPAIRERIIHEVEAIAAVRGLNIRGLMTMAPIVPQAEDARPVFASLAALRDALREELKLALPDLSMGMTDDYPVAVEEGATLVRIGRAIFGERER